MEIGIKFKDQTEGIRQHLLSLRERCEAFESGRPGSRSLNKFLKTEARSLGPALDRQFAGIWEEVKVLDRDRFAVYQGYIQKRLYRVLVHGIEVNTHIAKKPFGYAGDFEMMNYIYDYCGRDKWLGVNAYEKIINRYSTNLSICRGNIHRKEFIKKEILKKIRSKPNARILSVGCGPAREITEMMDEGLFNNETRYIFFDFERRAIEFVKKSLKANQRKVEVKAEFVISDIRDFILKEMPEALKGCDLVYASGIFDYFKKRTCLKVLRNIVKLIAPGGKVIVCNMSDEYAGDRAYYELLGDWFMYHRTGKELSELIPDDLRKIVSAVDFIPGTKKYHCLTLVNE